MISGDWKEKTENEAKIDVFSPESFLDFLNFLYTDSVEDIKAHVIELLEMADMYQVEGLRALCENTLLDNLDEENAGDIFQYAHLFSCGAKLKKASVVIIKRQIALVCHENIPEAFCDEPEKVKKMIEALNAMNAMNAILNPE